MSTEDDRLLRVWTPRLLRGLLAASVALLVAGLVAIAWTDPAGYVARYRSLRGGPGSAPQGAVPSMLDEAVRGPGHALLVAGLLVLTLVPIGRVAFAVVFFLRERDWLFAALTAVVLGLLCVGVLLGRIG